MLIIPLVRCDDQIYNRFIKQEIIGERDHNNDQLFNRDIKQEFIEEKDNTNDQLLIG